VCTANLILDCIEIVYTNFANEFALMFIAIHRILQLYDIETFYFTLPIPMMANNWPKHVAADIHTIYVVLIG